MHFTAGREIYLNMKKFLYVALSCALLFTFVLFGGCSKKVDYLSYISEKRTDIYLYSNDGLDIKIYLSEKENPYSTDGIKGNMGEITEIYVSLPKHYDQVEISVCGFHGEMNYSAVEDCY